MVITFIILGGVLIASVTLILLIGFFISGPVYKGPPSDHFDVKKFINQEGIKA